MTETATGVASDPDFRIQKPNLLEVRDLCVTARVDGIEKMLVSHVDLTLREGETIGIVGESGSGKSVTARALMGLGGPGMQTTGSILYNGVELLPSGSGRRMHHDFAMIFQDPFTMLNPLVHSGRHISESLRNKRGRRLHGAAARNEAASRLAEVGIHDKGVVNRYPFELSGGMRQRVGIAATLATNPKLLLADEPTTALDMTTQAEILALLKKIQTSRNMGMVLITHDLSVAFTMCDRVYVLYAGQLIEQAPSDRLRDTPLHPYTHGLLQSDPPLTHRASSLYSMPGSVPPAESVLHRCPFAARCEWATDACIADRTPLRPIDEERSTACIRIDEIRGELLPTPNERKEETQHQNSDTSSAATTIAVVQNLQKVFTRSGLSVAALEGVSLKIGAGESVGIVGESGSGKSTLGRCIVGLERPSGGTIRVGDIDVSDFDALSPQARSQVRSRVQMAFQDPYSTLSPARSVGSSLKEAIRLDGTPHPSMQREITDLLQLVGLPAEFANRKPASLSGGQRQRVALARALARKPDLIICDEIVSALDVSVQAQILTLLQRLQRDIGLAYLFITHDLAVVRQITDRVYVLYRGEIAEHGSTEDVLTNPQKSYTRKLLASVPARDHLPTSVGNNRSYAVSRSPSQSAPVADRTITEEETRP